MHPSLKRLRWFVRLILALGVAASVAANVLHAQPNPISRTISAWPPLALLLTVELVSRIPITVRWRGVIRVLATSAVAAIAAWVSYWHMAGLAGRYGEQSNYLLPITVDGLIVVASISLIEVNARLRTIERPIEQQAALLSAVAPVSPAVAPVFIQPVAAEDDAEPGTEIEVRGPRRAGRAGPQPKGPSKPGLMGKPLMEYPPQS